MICLQNIELYLLYIICLIFVHRTKPVFTLCLHSNSYQMLADQDCKDTDNERNSKFAFILFSNTGSPYLNVSEWHIVTLLRMSKKLEEVVYCVIVRPWYSCSRLATFLQPWTWISGPNKKLAFSVKVILFSLVVASYVKDFISSFSWIKHFIYIHCIFSLYFLLYSMVIHNCMTRQTSLRSTNLKRFTCDVKIYAF